MADGVITDRHIQSPDLISHTDALTPGRGYFGRQCPDLERFVAAVRETGDPIMQLIFPGGEIQWQKQLSEINNAEYKALYNVFPVGSLTVLWFKHRDKQYQHIGEGRV